VAPVAHSLAIVCAFGLLLVVACGTSPPSSSSDPAANDPTTDSVIGAPLALGATVSGTTDAKYHFTTARAYTATWIARWSGAAGGCEFIVVVTDDKATLNASSLRPSRDPGATGVLAGAAKGFHIAQISATGCEWELSVV
jgi:hypothetical protein